MKVKTAVKRIEDAINHGKYVEANAMLNKYRRKFGNRKFTYWMRVMIKNGLWEMGVK
jgi:ribosomal protein S20